MLVNPGRETVPAGSAARGSLPLRVGDPGRLADQPTSRSPARRRRRRHPQHILVITLYITQSFGFCRCAYLRTIYRK